MPDGTRRLPSCRELCHRLIPHAEAIVAEIAPNARKRGNRIFLGSVGGEPGNSLHINAKTGEWIDRANDDDCGDLLAFIREVACGGDSKKAYAWALKWLGEDRPVREVRVAEPEAPRHETLSANGQLIWSLSKKITLDDPAGQYLQARGCKLPHPHGDLRWIARHEHPCGRTGPALIGLVTDVHDAARPLSLHQTWISEDGSGRKAFDELPKETRPASRLYLANHAKGDGCIRLWPDEAVTIALGLGEGIETCLTLAREITPVWSLMDAGELGRLPYLHPIKSITVAIDGDPAGEKAFEAVAQRWSAAGAQVFGVRARKQNADLNDLVARTRHNG
jgi:putative DNA primase/helicase